MKKKSNSLIISGRRSYGKIVSLYIDDFGFIKKKIMQKKIQEIIKNKVFSFVIVNKNKQICMKIRPHITDLNRTIKELKRVTFFS